MSNIPGPQTQNQEQACQSTTATASSNPGAFSVGAGGVSSEAAAAISLANQQMAQQSMQSQSHQLQIYSPLTTHSNLQHATTSHAPPSVKGTQPNAAVVPPTQNAFTAGVANPAQFPPFAFTSHPFAAFLGGGFPSATHSLQQNINAVSVSAMAPPPATIQSMPHSAVATAAAQVVAAHAAAVSSGVMANAIYANMHHWKLGQLESHVQLLRETKQPTPQPVAMLLADARRKHEKRTAKRVANRKSASSSRARKKALIDEMTKANARLRRQAMILALLPDLVIAITVDGTITFCSAQVERVLRHPIHHLVGANFEAILTPSSREKLRQLVGELLAADQRATFGPDAECVTSIGNHAAVVKSSDVENGSGNQSSSSAREVSSSGEAVPASERSFPLKVVKVESQSARPEDNSDMSASNGGVSASSGGRKPATAFRLSSHSASFGRCGGDQGTAQPADRSGGTAEVGDVAQVKSDVSSGSFNQRAQAQTSSDDYSSSSNDSKNLRKANEALGRNVRWHNENLARKAKDLKKKAAHKDDVTGASVIANNAGARLSSLLHRAESPTDDKESIKKRNAAGRYDSLEDQYGNENASDDSGYRESNESLRDDTLSTSDDSSSLHNAAGPRPKPFAPACSICLIRDDLTTIWCEMTSTIRTRSLKDDDMIGEQFELLDTNVVSSKKTSSASNDSKDSKDPSILTDEDVTAKDEIKELLLCLRPIRDGEETVDESLRFVPLRRIPEVSDRATTTDSGAYNATTSSDGASKDHGSDGKAKHRPPKKRPIVSEDHSVTRVSIRKRRLQDDVTEKSAVESLILMGNKNAHDN